MKKMKVVLLFCWALLFVFMPLQANVIPYTEEFDTDATTEGWTTSVEGRFTPTILTEGNNSFLSVAQDERSNNGCVVTGKILNSKVGIEDDFFLAFDMRLGNSGGGTYAQAPVSFVINDASNKGVLFSLVAKGVSTNIGDSPAWMINDTGDEVFLPSSGYSYYGVTDITWCSYTIIRYKGLTFVSITNKETGQPILERTLIESSPTGGIGDIVFTTKRYRANLAIDNIVLRDFQNGDIPEIKPTTYTICYRDENNQKIKDDVVCKAYEGAVVQATPQKLLPITYAGQKYIYKSGNKRITLQSNVSSNVIVLTYSNAGLFHYVVNAVDYSGNILKTVGEGQENEGSEFEFFYPAYVVKDGQLYSRYSPYRQYSEKFTVTEDNQTFSIVYETTDINNVVYYTEAEQLDGATGYYEGNSRIRSSAGGMSYTENDIVCTTLNPGEYTLTSVLYAPNSSGGSMTFVIGDNEFTHSATSSNFHLQKFESFVLTKKTNVVLKKGGKNNIGIDLFYITGESVSDFYDTSTTVSFPEEVDVSDYAHMVLEMQNIDNGQILRSVVTDRTKYTFTNIPSNTLWNIVLRSERGEVFGRVDNVNVGESGVSVTFERLETPKMVQLSVYGDECYEENDKNLTKNTQITWTDEDGNFLSQDTILHAMPTGMVLYYSVAIPEELAMKYIVPEKTKYTVGNISNNIVLKLKPLQHLSMTGRVKEWQTGLSMRDAVVSATQTFGNKYTKTTVVKTDANGDFVLDLYAVPTKLTVAGTNYISQTVDISESQLSDQTTFNVPDVSLKPIDGVVINIHFTYTATTEDGEGETQEWFSDYANVDYRIFNVTKGCEITNFNVQYPQIVLLENVSEGDVLSISAISRKNAFLPVETRTIVAADQKADVQFDIEQLGRLQVVLERAEDSNIVGSIYDKNGKLVKVVDYQNMSLSVDNLADGDYTLITMSRSQFFNTVYELSQLSSTALVENVDYVRNEFSMKSGDVTMINISDVPNLDETKFYYTDDKTSFTANKTSVVVGNYITITSLVDFKPMYSSSVSNVQMIIDLPETCEFMEKSVLTGNSTGSYIYNDHRLIIPLNNYSSRVRFCVIPTSSGEFSPSGFVQFDLDGKTIMQPVGSVNYSAKNLTISVPSTVAITNIPVVGTAVGRSVVEIYDNDVLIGQTTSLANGSWATTCELNEPYNLSKHQIYAKVTTQQGVNVMSETVSCVYNKDAIQVSKVKMYYDNPEWHKTFELTFDFLNPSTQEENYSYYMNNKMFTFTIDFTENDPTKVSDVVLYVKTAKSGWHPLETVYDAKQEKWVAAGEFGNMSDGDLPVNVSVDFSSDVQHAIDSKQLADSKNDITNISNEFFRIKEKIESFYALNENATSDDYFNLCEQLGLSIDDEELLPIDTSLGEGMSEEEKEAFLEDKEKFYDEKFAAINKELANYSAMFQLHDNYELTLENGYKFVLESATSMTESDLLSKGYTRLPLTDGGNIYLLTTNEVMTLVNLAENTVIKIDIPSSVSSNLVRMKMSPLTDDFKEAFIKIETATALVKTINEDFQRRIMMPVDVQNKYISGLENDINEIKRIINCMCKEGSKKQKFWIKRLKDAEHTLSVCKTALKLSSPLLKCLATAIPIVSYLSTLYDCYKMASKLQVLYQSIPEPCLNDQENANWCKAQDISLVVATGLFAIGEVIAEITADCEILGGAAAAVTTGGASLAVSGWGIVQKVLVEMGKYALTEATKHFGVKELERRINALQCKNPDPYQDPNSGNDGTGGEHKSNNPDKKVGIDPSGFVYEGVTTNRLEGVTATIYYKENVEDMYGDIHENIVKWDASEYAQENPIVTDEYGMYRWDVPQGLWQVKFEKEGYETTYSEWLPVPPPQLDVNIAMVQSRQPEVKHVRAYNDGIEVEFDKYMLPASLNADNILVRQNGSFVAGEVKMLNEERANEYEDATYASKIRFVPTTPFTASEVTLLVSNSVKSYAGLQMQDNYQQTFDIEPELTAINAEPVVEIPYQGSITLAVEVLPVEASIGKTLKVKSSSSLITSIENESIVLDNEGKANIVVTGQIPGSASLTYTIEGYDLTTQTVVNVEAIYPETVATPTANIASGSSVEKGTAIILSCATKDAVIYYTLDGSCPCNETDARMIYDGTPIIINDNVTIKAMAVFPDMYDSDVATFIYTIKDDANAIIDVHNSDSNQQGDEWYDTSGRKLNDMPSTKGLYIKKGKKVVVK